MGNVVIDMRMPVDRRTRQAPDPLDILLATFPNTRASRRPVHERVASPTARASHAARPSPRR
jgi:hypothetical protein